MTYPWPYTTNTDVEIDADDILEYVKNNSEWFLSHLKNLVPERDVIKEALIRTDDILNEFDKIRRCRDKAANNRNLEAVKLYESVEKLRKYLQEQQ